MTQATLETRYIPGVRESSEPRLVTRRQGPITRAKKILRSSPLLENKRFLTAWFLDFSHSGLTRRDVTFPSLGFSATSRRNPTFSRSHSVWTLILRHEKSLDMLN